jgi:eukaryotic-like serine/threonine-protein kinase
LHDPQQLNAALAGRYIVEREIGQGGMATVYLAKDLRHNRHVALKVLSTELAAVVGRERFLSEIEVTANLHHPHLLPLFDSGDAGGLLFYVMPFIEGESLRARLQRERQLSIDDAIHIAAAIGSALDYAHRHGVIHRDLKPENILMHEREPLVMDFGIALAVSNAGGARVTQAGISLGTPQYMSPEQATGDRPIDARSDIYSLGAVTYELLVGQPPHTGSSVQSIMAKVITDRPESLRAQRETVPAHVEEAVMRALSKLPADRFVSAADFVSALVSHRSLAVANTESQILYASEVRQLPIAPAPRPVVSRRVLGVAAVGVLLAMAGGAIAARSMRKQPADPQARFVVEMPDSLDITNTQFRQLALARDGSRAVYHFSPNWPGPLFVRRTGEMHFDAIPGSDSGRSPVLSPDGKQVLYWLPTGDGAGAPSSFNRLMKLPIEGGNPVQIADSAFPHTQASWGDGHQVLFRRGDYLVLVSDSGGAERARFRPDTTKGQFAFGWPEILPGGRSALITILHAGGATIDSQFIGLLNFADSSVTDLGVNAFTPHFASGHVLYVRRDGQLFARPFEVKAGKFTGDAIAVAKDLSVRGATLATPETRGFTDLAVSDVGLILYTDGGPFGLVGGAGTRRSIVRRRGDYQTTEWLQVPQLAYMEMRASPDGSMLAFTIQDSTSSLRTDIHVYSFATGQTRRLTRDGRSSHPVWTPDGKRIVYRITNPGAKPIRRFYSQPWDESEQPSAIEAFDGAESVEFPGPAGKYVAIVRGDSGLADLVRTNSDIFIAPLDSPAAARPFAATGIRERMPRFSPDGKWLAYVGHELPSTSGGTDVSTGVVYVRPVPGPGAVVPVALPAGLTPLWSRDGTTLYFWSGAGPAPFTAARLSLVPEFKTIARDAVFGRPPPGTGFWSPTATWTTDMLPDGSVLYTTNGSPPTSALQQAGSQSTARPSTPAEFQSKVIAIVNWLGGDPSARAPR